MSRQRKDHENSSQMANIFARDAPTQHAKDFRQQNIMAMRQQQEEIKQKIQEQD